MKLPIRHEYQLDFLPEGTTISCCEGDRERILYRCKAGGHMLCDDGGGFVLDQDFLNRHECFVDSAINVIGDYFVH